MKKLTKVGNLLFVASIFMFSVYGFAALPTIPLKIESHTFQVEVAEKLPDLKRGLMHRKSLPLNRGMLFVYPKPGNLVIWMKNTLIPLDVIFISDDFKITHIHRDARPLSEKKIHSSKLSRYCLELNGGTCEQLGIRVGHRVIFKVG